MSTQDSLEMPMSTDQDDKKSMEDFSGAPKYFAVSLLKLVVMSICTLGAYELYWFYKNWVLIKERESLDIMPFWRTFFAYFFCYSLFKRVQVSAAAIPLEKSMSPGLLATGWIISTLLWNLPDPFWLVTYIAIIFLLPVQAIANDINEFVAPGHDKNDKFSGWNVFGIVVGGLIFLLTLWGTLLPLAGSALTVKASAPASATLVGPVVITIEATNPHDDPVILDNVDVPYPFFQNLDIVAVRPSPSPESPVRGLFSQTWYFEISVPPQETRTVELDVVAKHPGAHVAEFEVCNFYENCSLIVVPIEFTE